ncbi:hypothetical protein [Endozoicomonas sp. ONNA2]|uniref:hypothetical protein n=1 Tax=Endozoicomonas sp. ONNA2 TaxID=2828741 RepID=UPI002147FA66|nr:hypothetical protein [Endozoicomonas sp. ONNA2]
MIPVNVHMIKSFEDTGLLCKDSYPCRHDAFRVQLFDGRTVTRLINSVDVCSILNDLKEHCGITHRDWKHFTRYSNMNLRPSDEILTRLFTDAGCWPAPTNQMAPVNVHMITKFKDTGLGCTESDPCHHAPFRVKLDDGRKVTTTIKSVDVCSILNDLKEQRGITHRDWEHFSDYSNRNLRPSHEILTELFAEDRSR